MSALTKTAYCVIQCEILQIKLETEILTPPISVHCIRLTILFITRPIPEHLSPTFVWQTNSQYPCPRHIGAGIYIRYLTLQYSTYLYTTLVGQYPTPGHHPCTVSTFYTLIPPTLVYPLSCPTQNTSSPQTTHIRICYDLHSKVASHEA